MNYPVCIPIDRRNEVREKGGGSGFGKDGDPMFTLTASLGMSGIQPLVFLEETDEGDSGREQ